MHTVEAGTGFFGKVRSHGDFVTRRLPDAFTRPWDDWLQGMLRSSQQALGPTWLTTYLNSPIWRFALAPGICGEPAWAGVLMPSVDRVGRHFPLTVAAATVNSNGTVSLFDWMAEEGAWYDQIETLALSSLSENFSLDAFDVSLRSLTALPHGSAPDQMIALEGLDQLRGTASQLSRSIANALLKGHSLWWTDGSQQVAPCVLVRQGLPTADVFPSMLDGCWASRGGQDSHTSNTVMLSRPP